MLLLPWLVIACSRPVKFKKHYHERVAAISVGIVRTTPLLDLKYDEDSKADVDMNVVCTGDGRLIEVQGTAEREPFTREQMERLTRLSRSGN